MKVRGWREALRHDRGLVFRIARRLEAMVRDPTLRNRAEKLARTLRCPGMLSVDPGNMDPGWLNRETTPGERAAIQFLEQRLGKTPRILHVGIGTGELGRSLSNKGAEVIGISIAGGEIANAGLAYRRTHLVDKYSLKELGAALGDAKFHWIVDVTLFSYACCWGHAIRFLWFLDGCLADGGCIVTHVSGARYAPTGCLLTPSLMERLATLTDLRVTAVPNGIIVLERAR